MKEVQGGEIYLPFSLFVVVPCRLFVRKGVLSLTNSYVHKKDKHLDKVHAARS